MKRYILISQEALEDNALDERIQEANNLKYLRKDKKFYEDRYAEYYLIYDTKNNIILD